MAYKKLPVPASRVEELIADLAKENREVAVAQKKTETALASLVEEHKKTEVAQLKTEVAQQKTEAGFVKLQEELRETRKQLGSIGNVQGEVAEDLFRRNFWGLMKMQGIALNKMRHGIKTLSGYEYDLVGINGSVVVLAEIKHKLNKRDIKKLVRVQIPRFRRDYPVFSEHGIIGAIGGLVVKEEIQKLAESLGLYVLTQQGKDGAQVANSPGFEAKIY